MSAESDRAEYRDRLELSLMWTASVVLEVRSCVGDCIVTRRKGSVFVGADGACVTFPPDDVAGQMPVQKTQSGKRRSIQLPSPAVRWFVTSKAPIDVCRICLTDEAEAIDMVLTKTVEGVVIGAVQGSLPVPSGFLVRFYLRRDAGWSNSLPMNAAKKRGDT